VVINDLDIDRAGRSILAIQNSKQIRHWSLMRMLYCPFPISWRD